MAKSFKKVIACLLAVLMVCCTMPFSAIAAPGDYTPDVQLQFGTLGDADNEKSPWITSGDPSSAVQLRKGSYSPAGAPVGIMGPMVTATGSVDVNTGVYSVSKLQLKKSVVDNVDSYYEYGSIDEDYTFKKGDLITVTVRMDKTDNIFAAQVAVKYSDNLIPAGIYQTGTGNKAYTYVGTELPGTAKSSCGFEAPVEESSSVSLYDRSNTLLGDQSAIETDDDGVSYMYSKLAANGAPCETNAINLLEPDEDEGTILTTNADGTFGNYYEDKAVLETFVFMLADDISAENPIEFSMYDTDDSKFGGFEGGYLVTCMDETDPSAYTTYAINKYKSETENAGSAKMTFFGTNVNKEAPAPGVKLTIDDKYSTYGDVKVDAEKTALGTIVYGTDVTITATPVEGAEFVGYEIGGKLVSTDPVYSYTAYVDLEVTPVFQNKSTGNITVVFYDMYSNVVASYPNVKAEDFQDTMKKALPTAPVYAGYEFVEWDKTDDEIKALDESATIWAQYKKADNEGFTVTCDYPDVTIDCGEYENGSLPFDAQVTVSRSDAKAWRIGETVVGYGNSYTFYVGSDVTVDPVTDAVDVKPNVANVSYYKVSNDSHKVFFLATKVVPSDITLVDHGFIYGKNLEESEMVLENVGKQGAKQGAGVIKQSSLGTADVEQFAISYGITAQTGKACARAYVSFVNASGNVETVYADAFVYTY